MLLDQPLELPCGAQIKNRIAKSAMTEGLANFEGIPTDSLTRLYSIWGLGGAGLLLSGNIMVDRGHLERPGNVILEEPLCPSTETAVKAWTDAGRCQGAHVWAQISHLGRQTLKIVNAKPKAPSAVPLKLPGGEFGRPIELSIQEIEQIIEKFARCALIAKRGGFTGVQIHAAHGYLLSQFLSPRSNLRDDRYGGSLVNRARALIEVVSSTRRAVGKDFPVAVKLNSSDFQRGGFSFEECIQVVSWLGLEGIDLVEISGGNYEQPKLLGISGLESEFEPFVSGDKRKKEAYFADFATAIREKISVPLMVTGGFRRREMMCQAIKSGSVDLIGLARPMCVMTDAPNRLLEGLTELPRFEDTLSLLPSWLNSLDHFKIFRAINGFAVQYWYYAQLEALGFSGEADSNITVFEAAKNVLKAQKIYAAKNRKVSKKIGLVDAK